MDHGSYSPKKVLDDSKLRIETSRINKLLVKTRVSGNSSMAQQPLDFQGCCFPLNHEFEFNGHNCIELLFLLGTQMTLVLVGKGLVLRGLPSKIEVFWFPGESNKT